MLFNSIKFAIFFPIVTLIYYALPHKLRWLLLLLSSCVFYMAFIPAYILILLVTIIIDYYAGIWIEQSSGVLRKAFLIFSILSTCIVLFIFKYFEFFNHNIDVIAEYIGWNYPISSLNIILPIGLSFHTFQSLSYVIEVYRGHQKAERHFGIYSLYVMFYPQLVAGPIERPQNLLHQFHEEKTFIYTNLTFGLRLMAWGLFKKVVIADRLAIYVNAVYNEPIGYNGPVLTLATIAFAYQIYCDFSGYSDIARGAARVMGFNLMKNFDSPYFSQSIGEFWRRWHISLSTWFRDYLYIPLGGNKVTQWKVYRNLLVTFMISGFWHGANWTFIIWGAINGIYLIMGNITDSLRKRIGNILGFNRHENLLSCFRVFITFTLICIAWVFFRSNNLSDATYILMHLSMGWEKPIQNIIDFSSYDVVLAIGSITVLHSVEFIQEKLKENIYYMQLPIYVTWTTHYILVAAILLFGVFESTQFIYFQF